jgi:hypothetical protein
VGFSILEFATRPRGLSRPPKLCGLIRAAISISGLELICGSDFKTLERVDFTINGQKKAPKRMLGTYGLSWMKIKMHPWAKLIIVVPVLSNCTRKSKPSPGSPSRSLF